MGSYGGDVLRFAVGQNGDDGIVGVPVADVRRLVHQLGQEPRNSAGHEARRLLARAVVEGRAAAGPCLLSGFHAWEVLWAIQRLPDTETSPPLHELRRLLAAAKSPPEDEQQHGERASPQPS